MPKLTIEEIAEIRNSLQVLQGKAELIVNGGFLGYRGKEIIEEVKRIDKLLPIIKFEGGK